MLILAVRYVISNYVFYGKTIDINSIDKIHCKFINNFNKFVYWVLNDNFVDLSKIDYIL
jgi:hypothetical protein